MNRTLIALIGIALVLGVVVFATLFYYWGPRLAVEPSYTDDGVIRGTDSYNLPGTPDYYGNTNTQQQPAQPKANPIDNGMLCTADVMLCPDGTYVGRGLPNCEFIACPGTAR